jgi:hypothetical protein
MPKRFTDTNKLKKKWLRGLKAPYKLLWIYLLDSCDHAGIWEVDFEIANIYIGGGTSEQNAISVFKDKIHIFDDGNKWFIIDFIDFQYSGLNANNPAHNNVIKQLKKYNLIDDNLNIKISPSKAPLQGTKEEEEEKEKVKEEEKEIIYPFDSKNFELAWGAWLKYKKDEHKFKFKSKDTEQISINKLAKDSEFDEKRAISIIENSIACGYQGLYEGKRPKQTKIPDNYKQEVYNDVKDYLNG